MEYEKVQSGVGDLSHLWHAAENGRKVVAEGEVGRPSNMPYVGALCSAGRSCRQINGLSMSHLERHTLLQLGRFGLIAFRSNALGRHETRDTAVGSPQWIEHFSGIGSLRQTGALAVRFQTKLRIQRRPEVYLSDLRAESSEVSQGGDPSAHDHPTQAKVL